MSAEKQTIENFGLTWNNKNSLKVEAENFVRSYFSNLKNNLGSKDIISNKELYADLAKMRFFSDIKVLCNTSESQEALETLRTKLILRIRKAIAEHLMGSTSKTGGAEHLMYADQLRVYETLSEFENYNFDRSHFSKYQWFKAATVEWRIPNHSEIKSFEFAQIVLRRQKNIEQEVTKLSDVLSQVYTLSQDNRYKNNCNYVMEQIQIIHWNYLAIAKANLANPNDTSIVTLTNNITKHSHKLSLLLSRLDDLIKIDQEPIKQSMYEKISLWLAQTFVPFWSSISEKVVHWEVKWETLFLDTIFAVPTIMGVWTTAKLAGNGLQKIGLKTIGNGMMNTMDGFLTGMKTVNNLWMEKGLKISHIAFGTWAYLSSKVAIDNLMKHWMENSKSMSPDEKDKTFINFMVATWVLVWDSVQFKLTRRAQENPELRENLQRLLLKDVSSYAKRWLQLKVRNLIGWQNTQNVAWYLSYAWVLCPVITSWSTTEVEQKNNNKRKGTIKPLNKDEEYDPYVDYNDNIG